MRLTKDLIITTASAVADINGLSGVSLKSVAAALHTSTPSLYNHIDNLDHLLHLVAHTGMEQMNHDMTQAAIGISGDAAIHAVGAAYLNYMILHPGVYETIQWVSYHPEEQTLYLIATYNALIEKLIQSYEYPISDPALAIRLLKGFLHGYTTQQLGSALHDKNAALTDLSAALDIVLLGIRQYR